MANNPPPTSGNAFVEEEPGPSRPDDSQSSVFPFLEDDDSRELQAMAARQPALSAQPVRAHPPTPVAAQPANPPQSSAGLRCLNVILLTILGLALSVLVFTSIYLLFINPTRLVELLNAFRAWIGK